MRKRRSHYGQLIPQSSGDWRRRASEPGLKHRTAITNTRHSRFRTCHQHIQQRCEVAPWITNTFVVQTACSVTHHLYFEIEKHRVENTIQIHRVFGFVRYDWKFRKSLLCITKRASLHLHHTERKSSSGRYSNIASTKPRRTH